ncbi:MAG TPA: cysteine-rich CWC family protein [Pseudolabrys sp.]|nr:cysteine-rich CWC family protein [Pseudolabrys sp.]
MTDTAPSPRRLACARCRKEFECGLAGDCWCAAEPYRLPLTQTGESEDCLCPDCLRQAAAGQGAR